MSRSDRAGVKRKRRDPGPIKVVWARKPSPEAIFRAQLRLLGWKPAEIEREVEEWRAEREQATQEASGHLDLCPDASPVSDG